MPSRANRYEIGPSARKRLQSRSPTGEPPNCRGKQDATPCLPAKATRTSFKSDRPLLVTRVSSLRARSGASRKPLHALVRRHQGDSTSWRSASLPSQAATRSIWVARPSAARECAREHLFQTRPVVLGEGHSPWISTLPRPVSLGLIASWPRASFRTRTGLEDAVSATWTKTDSYTCRRRRSRTCAAHGLGNAKSPFCDGGSPA